MFRIVIGRYLKFYMHQGLSFGLECYFFYVCLVSRFGQAGQCTQTLVTPPPMTIGKPSSVTSLTLYLLTDSGWYVQSFL
mgnify:CR=1 FL=1